MALEVQPHAGGELLQRLAGGHVNLRRSCSRPNCKGKLSKVAEDELGMECIGDAHVAGSDALLLTLSCSSHTVRSSGHKFAARLSLLSGAEQLDIAMLSSRAYGVWTMIVSSQLMLESTTLRRRGESVN